MPQQEDTTQFLSSTGQRLDGMPKEIRPGTVGAIFDESGGVLLEKRSDNGFWGLPGGGVDIGESVEECVVREVLEETGLVVTVKRLVGIYSDPRHYSVATYPDGGIVQYVSALFECVRASGELRISSESTDIGYFATDALPEDTMPGHHIRIQDVLAGRAKPFIR